jgi:AAA15 family ATPase/GTPase
MLIRFTVENFLSFKDKTTFSMIKSAEKNLPEHVITQKGFSALKGAVIYGANASGKSNLLKAVDTAKSLIEDSHSSKAYHFKLASKNRTSPSMVEFEFAIDDKNAYAYGFSWDITGFKEEWLYKLSKQSETKLFTRKGKIIDADKKQFAGFEGILKNMPENQLVLNFIAKMDISKPTTLFRHVSRCFDWFEKSLLVIFPNYSFGNWVRLLTQDDFIDHMKNSLDLFGIHLDDIAFESIKLGQVDLTKEMISDIDLDLKEKETTFIYNSYQFYLFQRKQDRELSASELKFFRNDDAGNKQPFTLKDESDGTKRLTDFIPLFLIIKERLNMTIFIDEMDRSLHPELTRKLLENLLAMPEPSQTIITTHDVGLLDSNLLRRDEIWFTEKKEGASIAYSLSDFKLRKDKSVTKDYLVGRYGAIPCFGSNTDWLVTKS